MQAGDRARRVVAFWPWVLVVLATFVGMTFFELGLSTLAPGLPPWGAHVATVAFATAVAAVGGALVLRRFSMLREQGRRAQAELLRLSKVFRDAADPIILEDLGGRIIDLNPEAERVYGWTRDELIGRSIKTILPAHRHEAADEYRARCLRGESIRNVELQRVSKGGVVYPVLVTLSLLTDEEGGPAGFATITKHITKLKEDEEVLRRSEERYRALVGAILETAVDGIITIDDRGRIELANPAALRMFGYSAEELIGRNVSKLMPESERGTHDNHISRYLRTGERRIIGIGREVEGVRKDGSTFPIDLAVSEIVVEGRHSFTAFVRDITSRKKAAEDLRQERDFAESLIATAQAIVLVLDRDGRIVRFNPYMERLSGYRLDEVRGLEWFTTFLPERDAARVRRIFVEALADVEVRGAVNAIVTKGGAERDIAWWARPLKDAEGRVTGVLSVGQDVTDLRQAQEKLLQAERLAGIGQMITGLAHESRNALQRMQACLEMLALEIEDRPAAVDYLRRIQAAQDYLGQLYEEVRNYAKPIQLERRPCDLRRLWGAAWADLLLRRQGKPIELEDRTEGVDLRCDVDPFAFGQVFRNLFENAISACGERGRIAILASESDRDGARMLTLVVNDDGPGFAPEQFHRVFQPFFTTKTQGTGLGLAIVKRIVEAHGGRVAVGEGPLPGAALLLTIPRSLG